MSFLDSAAPAAPRDAMMGGSALSPPDALGAGMSIGEGGGGQLPTMMPQAGGPQAPQISPEHQKLLDWSDQIKTPNIAVDLDDEELSKISVSVMRGLKIDEDSRSEWLTKNEAALDLALQVAKDKTYPWNKASNIVFPLVTIAAIQFAARAYPAVVAGRNVVKGVVMGDDSGEAEVSPQDGTPMFQVPPPGPDGKPAGEPQPVWKTKPGEKKARADRVGAHMSYQLLDCQKEWDSDTDTLLHILPIAGCHFRKTYFDPVFRINISTLVSAKNVIINYRAKSMERAPRISERIKIYPHEVEEKVRTELFLDEELGAEPEAGDDVDAPRTFIEQHCRLDLDDDGYSEPYTVLVHEASSKVVRITARYDADSVHVSRKDPTKIVSIEPVHYYTKFDFMPSLDGGIYGTGFGQLLQPINRAINTTLNMLIDAGHLAVVGGGFIGKGVSMNGGSVRFKPSEWKTLNVPGSVIRDAIVPLPAPGPNPVLFQLLGLLIDAGKEIAASNDVLEGSSNMSTMQPTTMLALIEQGLKVFTSIYKRVYRSLKEEYEKLYRLNRVYMNELEDYEVGGQWYKITREDYLKGSGVKPYSDPQMVSDMQKLGRAQFLLSLKDDPRMDGQEILRRALEAADIERGEECLAKNPPPDPMVVTMVAETQAKIASERAKQVKDYAQAILYLATADEKEHDGDMSWITTQLEIMRTRMEMANGQQAQGSGASDGPESGGGAGDHGAAPPLAGAKQAPDGQWYTPDPHRAGKYLQVIANGG